MRELYLAYRPGAWLCAMRNKRWAYVRQPDSQEDVFAMAAQLDEFETRQREVWSAGDYAPLSECIASWTASHRW
jgi:hypothetical protein